MTPLDPLQSTTKGLMEETNISEETFAAAKAAGSCHLRLK